MHVTLKNLVIRLDNEQEFLKKNPEKKEMLEKRISLTKELIIKCILQNKNDNLLENFILK